MINQQSPNELLLKYQSALSHAKMGFWEYHFQTKILKWDEGLRKLYDLPAGQYESPIEAWFLKVHHEDRERIKNELTASQKDTSEVDTLFRVEVKKSTVRYFRTNALKIRDDKNNVTSLIGINWDVTDALKLQKKLNKSEQFLENIFDALPDPVFLKNKDYQYILVNKAFENLLGVPKSDILYKTDFEISPRRMAESCFEQDERVFKSQQASEKEETTNFPNQPEQSILTKKTVIQLEKGEDVLVGVIRDITEIKKIQNSLIAQSKLASLGEMAAGVAHEINNPLMIIQAKAQILQDKIQQKQISIQSDKLMTDLQSIELNSKRIDRIVKSLKTLSRRSNMDPYEDVSIRKIIEESYEISKERFGKHQINFYFIFDESIGYNYCVKARSSEIVQVLVNLLNNSFDAVLGLPNSWVKITLALLKSSFRIDVTNSGPQIKAEISEKMMEPFFTTKASGAGTGLGLSVSNEIIKSHQGQLFYDSNCKFTRFVFHLNRSESVNNL